MLLLGIVGIIQVTWLPGFLLLRITHIKTSWLGNLIFGFALSLTFNYLLVLALTVLKIFVQWLVIVIFCLELLLAIWLSRKFLLENSGARLRAFWLQLLTILQSYSLTLKGHLIKKERDTFYRKLLFGFLFLLALIPLWWALRIFINNLGSVFNAWDAIVSWNQWATQWAANTIPSSTMAYPQLIPSNWALVYVLTGNTTVQFFSKSIMPLFLFSILLLAMALGFEKRNAGFFLGGAISYFVIKHFLGEYIPEGYVDIPVAFMSLAAIATLFWAQAKEEKAALRILLLGSILAGGAAVTKQTGLYILVAFPILAYVIVIRKFQKNTIRKIVGFLLIFLLVVAVIAAPWYIYKGIDIIKGVDKTQSIRITGHVTSANFTLLNLLTLVFSQISKYIILYLILLVSLFFFEKEYRWLVLIIPIPYTILWALFLSYDTRNLSIALPFVSLLSGVGLVAMLDWGYRKILRPVVDKLPMASMIFLIALVPIAASFVYTSKTIMDQQITLQKHIFSASLDDSLYSTFQGKDLTKIKILTNYPVHYLPGFEQSQVNFWFNDLATFQSEIKDPALGYLLVPSYASADIQDDIQTLLKSGQLKFFWEDHSWISYSLYEIIR